MNAYASTKIPSRSYLGKLHLKSLLVPVDFSSFSLSAVAYADFLSGESGAIVDLLHVVEPPRIPESVQMSRAHWRDLIVSESASILTGISEDKFENEVHVQTEVRVGKPYHEICAAARRGDQDLIVMGTHGRTGLKHLFLGSTAERVVRFAPCSVLVVRRVQQNNGEVVKPKKILVPTDFSRGSKLALEAAVVLAKQFDASLLLLNVIPTCHALGGYEYLDCAELAGAMRESAESEFREIVKKISQTGVKAETCVAAGRPVTEIVELASTFKADLIVISKRGRTGVRHLLPGSTTEQVVRHAPCNVLVFRNKKDNQFAFEENGSRTKSAAFENS